MPSVRGHLEVGRCDWGCESGGSARTACDKYCLHVSNKKPSSESVLINRIKLKMEQFLQSRKHIYGLSILVINCCNYFQDSWTMKTPNAIVSNSTKGLKNESWTNLGISLRADQRKTIKVVK